MPAQKDHTVWTPVEGDHADDTTYLRTPLDPTKPPTDEQQTADEVGKGDDK